jgi:hypothetical protein
MKQLLSVLAIAGMAFSFVATKANAELKIPSTIGELYTACLKVEGNKSMYGEDMFYGGYCLGVIQGWHWDLAMNCILERDNPLRSKAAVHGVSLIALTQAFINYAKDNPQDWNDLAFGGLTLAFKKYFPCKD